MTSYWAFIVLWQLYQIHRQSPLAPFYRSGNWGLEAVHDFTHDYYFCDILPFHAIVSPRRVTSHRPNSFLCWICINYEIGRGTRKLLCVPWRNWSLILSVENLSICLRPADVPGPSTVTCILLKINVVKMIHIQVYSPMKVNSRNTEILNTLLAKFSHNIHISYLY